MLIDSSYFAKIDVNIPPDLPIDDYIERYEPEILTKLLGYELYKEVAASSATSGVIYDLINGKEYTLNGETVKWNGFKNTEKISLIAYYVYYKFLEVNTTGVGTIGLFVPNLENGQKVSHVSQMIYSWNKMLDLYGVPSIYFEELTDDYYKASAYNFLNENSSDYPTWQFEVLKPKNRFDI